MIYTNDPVRDAETYYSNLERVVRKRPFCSICGERIQDEYAFKIDLHDYNHYDCFMDEFYKRVEDEINYED